MMIVINQPAEFLCSIYSELRVSKDILFHWWQSQAVECLRLRVCFGRSLVLEI